MDAIATLMNVSQVAEFLGVSARQVWNLRSGGLLPEPVRLGRSSRWRRSELIAWVDSGCPPQNEWAALNLSMSKSKEREYETSRSP